MSTLLRPYAACERATGVALLVTSGGLAIELFVLVDDHERAWSVLLLAGIGAVVTGGLLWRSDRTELQRVLPGLPQVDDPAMDEATAARRALLRTGLVGVVTAAAVGLILATTSGAPIAVAIGLTCGHGIGRLGAARAVRAQERESAVLVCRGPGRAFAGFYKPLDLERLVAVPVGRDATVPRS